MTNLKKESNDSVEITHQYPVLNGIRYHYAEAGNGPLIIMLHGNLELWYSWRHQFAALANLRKAVVLPGCGHWVQQERAEEVNKLIIEFLNQEIK